MWVWSLSMEVMGLLIIIWEGVWWNSVSVVKVVVPISLVQLSVGLIGWLGHDWKDVGWCPDVSM